MKALGESWERTRGSEFPIIGAALALFAVFFAIIITSSALFEKSDPVGIALSQLASTAMSVISLAMGVAIYGLMVTGRSTAPQPA